MADLQDKTLHHSFPPLSAQEPTVLILGSLPGPESLARGQYYARRGNAFWPILFALCRRPQSDSYPLRRALITENGLALWDVYAAARRAGAADTAIRDGAFNDIEGFVAAHPTLRGVVCNGAAAERGLRPPPRGKAGKLACRPCRRRLARAGGNVSADCERRLEFSHAWTVLQPRPLPTRSED